MANPEPGQLCVRCGVHPATENVAQSVLDYAHGAVEVTCRCCALAGLLEEARTAAALIPSLEAELAEACGGEGVPPWLPMGWLGYEEVRLAELNQHGLPHVKLAGHWEPDFETLAVWVHEAPEARGFGGPSRQPVPGTEET